MPSRGLDFRQRALGALGLDKRRRIDRRVLERLIFPWLLAQQRWRRILFVGCAWYTQRYNLLFSGREFWTLESDPRLARYGAERHVVASMEQLAEHFRPGSLDVIVCNGVLGWGLNDAATAERAFAACHTVLAEGGLLIIGWNDVPHRRGRELTSVPALRRFVPYAGSPLGVATIPTATRNRHTYSFFVRPASGRHVT